VVFCFDSVVNDRKTAANSALSKEYGYKSNRKQMPKEFYERVNRLKEFLVNFYGVSEKKGYEADDVLYSLSRLCLGPHYIYTNDDDLLQAVSDKQQVRVVKSFMSKLYEWDEAKVQEKYGVRPSLLPMLRAFIGDKSDNLPGVSRINRKYLATLLEWCADNAINPMSMPDEVLTADWKPKELERIREFINEGLWAYNYELMKLSSVSVEIAGPRLDEKQAVKTLNEWEIKSLKICGPFRDQLGQLEENEEF